MTPFYMWISIVWIIPLLGWTLFNERGRPAAPYREHRLRRHLT